MTILEVKDLSKNYGRIRAVNSLNLEVNKGQVYGILGPNGSGKTTTLGMVLGIIRPDRGNFTWFRDQNINNPLHKVGALLETPNFYPYLHADGNLAIVRHIKRSSETNFDRILELVHLKKRRTSKFRTYSLGMKQRLAIASALIGDPEVLIFDEPTNGLDPEGIADVRNIIVRIAEMGKTIIMASHILAEVEKVCSHVAILKEGQLLASGHIGAILSDDKIIEIRAPDMDKVRQLVISFKGFKFLSENTGYLLIGITGNHTAGDLNQFLFSNGIVLDHLQEKRATLEEEFLEIVK